MPSIRIGCVQYLNTLPLIEGLRTWRDVEIIPAVPSKLIGLLLDGHVDIALASVFDCATAPEPVTLIPAGMIGSSGPTLTVRLYAQTPLDQITQLSVDSDSHTSRALAEVLLYKLLERRVEVVDFAASTSPSPAHAPVAPTWPQALLLIGDKVVTAAPPSGLYPHQLDLGAAWKQLTGLPFVYATWMCRSFDAQSPKIHLAAAMLDRQRRHNATRLDWLVSARASEKHWPTDLAQTYVGTYLKYDLREPEREAITKFLSWSADLGLCPRTQPTWLNTNTSDANAIESSKTNWTSP
jgi:chorismate dehydratase